MAAASEAATTAVGPVATYSSAAFMHANPAFTIGSLGSHSALSLGSSSFESRYCRHAHAIMASSDRCFCVGSEG